MDKINSYLLILFLTSGIKVVLKEEDIAHVEDTELIDKVYEKLMDLRKSDNQLYLECLSILVLYSYSFINTSLCFSTDHHKKKDENKLLGYINNSDNTKHFDKELWIDGELGLIKQLLNAYLGLMIECDYGEACFRMWSSVDLMSLYEKYAKTEILGETFNHFIDYSLTEDQEVLVETVEETYEYNKSVEVAYKLHQKIMEKLIRSKDLYAAKEYINHMLWITYVRGIVASISNESSSQLDSFVRGYEYNLDYIEEVSEDLLGDTDYIPEIFDLFVKTAKIGNFWTIDEPEDYELRDYEEAGEMVEVVLLKHLKWEE